MIISQYLNIKILCKDSPDAWISIPQGWKSIRFYTDGNIKK